MEIQFDLHKNSFAGPRDFARAMLEKNRVPLQLDSSRINCWNGKVMEVILFRESIWQVALISGFPGIAVPTHRHNRVNSCELALGGHVLARVGRRTLPTTFRGSLAANMTYVSAGVWHGGEAGPNGVVFLSFQHWVKGEPGWLADDWEEFDGKQG